MVLPIPTSSAISSLRDPVRSILMTGRNWYGRNSVREAPKEYTVSVSFSSNLARVRVAAISRAALGGWSIQRSGSVSGSNSPRKRSSWWCTLVAVLTP